MKKLLFSLLGAGALTLASCTNDLLGDGSKGQFDSGEYAYIRTTIALPTAGTRSQTDTVGQTNSNGNGELESDFEYGYDYENDVRSVLLVIATENDEYITHLVVTGLTSASQTNLPYKFTADAKIPYEILEDAYGTDGVFSGASKTNRPKVHLYAFCNFTQLLYTKFEALTPNSKTKEWLDFTGTVEETASQAGQTPSTTSSIWSPRSFLMSNASVYTAEFPGDLDEWDPFADTGHPLVLTTPGYLDNPQPDPNTTVSKPINVERTAARIDFRDASTSVSKEPFTYDITMNIGNNGKVEELSLFSVQLKRMVLVNMNKDFYYLRRVSDDGSNTNSIICGTETPFNYVVDVNAEQKRAGIDVADAGDYFNFPLFDKTGNYYNNIGYSSDDRYGWYVSDIEDVLTGNKDNWSGSANNQYSIWRYVTENTLPNIESQQVQQSTGIIFKAAIKLGPDVSSTGDAKAGNDYVSDALVEALTDIYKEENKNAVPESFPAIYSFHNRLYGGVPDIVAAAVADGNGGSLYFAVEEILKHWSLDPQTKTFVYSSAKKANANVPSAPTGPVVLTPLIAHEILNGYVPTDGSFDYSVMEGDKKVYKIDFSNEDADAAFSKFENARFIELAPDQQITVFIPTNDDGEGLGYYCYYFYWNRHNDNLLNGKMGPMEFAIVRNNVYKLAVTGINSIGHPRGRDRDPDPVTPGDPDEELTNSIQVEINVLPWVVRENNIVF